VLGTSPSSHAPQLPDLAERRFRALQQAIPEIVWSVSASGDLLRDAPAWRELTGQTEEQLLAPLGWLEVVHPEDRERTLQTFLAAANERKAWSVEHRLRLADQTFCRMRARGAPVLDDSGRVLEIIVVHEVGRPQQESQSELLMRTLAESIPALVWRTGADGRSEFLNGMARRFFGPEGGIVRDAWVERLHPDDRERAMHERARGVHREELFDLQYRMRDDSGEYRVFYTRTAPVRENGKTIGWVGTALDVTDRTRVESEVRRVAAFTEELLAIVGHDLRDPLNIVLLATTLLRMTELRDEQRKPVARIAAAAERAARMLETLLDFTQARIGGGIKLRRAPTDLARLCTDLAAEQERIQVEVSATGDCSGSWDRARLEQLIGNLLRNAAEHGAPGRAVELRCTAEADRVVLSVRNAGAPIAPEMMPTLFEPFKRGARGPGSRNLGLGLYIVRQIAVAHGGSVEARSSAEEGTEVRVLLPR
jgi:PAS domain S-box-containing protein